MVPSDSSDEFDPYEKGLLELGSLFAAYDLTLNHRPYQASEAVSSYTNKQLLITVHDTLTRNTPRPTDYDLIQRADYLITKHWMQILLWHQALSQGLLSSTSNVESMTFLFPSHIAQDLLASIATMTESDLLPLGRDQVGVLLLTLAYFSVSL